MSSFTRVVVAGLVLMASGAAFAQADTTEPRTKLTIPQMVAQAKTQLEGMRAGLSQSFEELEKARGSQDIQRLGCVNEALTAVKGLVRLAEQNYVALREAAARGDYGSAEHEFVKLSLAAGKASELGTQLKACAGPTVSVETEGRPDVTLQPDSDLPPASDDPQAWFSTTDVVLQVPNTSSPFL